MYSVNTLVYINSYYNLLQLPELVTQPLQSIRGLYEKGLFPRLASALFHSVEKRFEFLWPVGPFYDCFPMGSNYIYIYIYVYTCMYICLCHLREYVLYM